MKLKQIITTSLILVSVAMFTSGYRAGALNNYTGSNTAVVGCGSCHGQRDGRVVLGVTLDSAGTPVAEFVPGNRYNLNVIAGNTSPYNYPLFGFQVTTVRAVDASPVQCGAFIATVLPPNTQLTNVLGGVRMFQHDGGIAPYYGGGAVGSLYRASTVWTAPTDADSVVISAVAAFTKTSVADTQMWNTSSTVYYRKGFVGLHDVQHVHAAKIYPNPARDFALVLFGDATEQVGLIRLFDMSGREVTSFQATVSVGGARLITTDLITGLYYGLAKVGDKTYSFRFTKE